MDEKPKTNILELFETAKNNKSYIRVSAPMVRYSKLEFRELLRKYNVDLCFTPMIMANSFCQSSLARQSEFTTNLDDTPLIVQFASNSATDMLTAAKLIYPYSDGVDLNCGCPQRWAQSLGLGCCLLKTPNIIYDIIKTLKRNLSTNFSCSIKIRLLNSDIALKNTINLCRQLEYCGCTFITVHGRTINQKSTEPCNLIAIDEIKKSLRVPIIGNGNIKTFNDAHDMFEKTNCDGVMAARGLLTNPTLFTNTKLTTYDCVQNWLNVTTKMNSLNIKEQSYQLFHHHLIFMLEKLLPKKLRLEFNNFTTKLQIYEFLNNSFNMKNNVSTIDKPMKSFQSNYNLSIYENNRNFIKYYRNESGKYFNEFKNASTETETDDGFLSISNCSIFDLKS